MMKIRWLSHSGFEIISRNNILIDPYITGNNMAPCRIDELKPDIVCITHAHKPHLGDAEAIGKKTKATIVGTMDILMHMGIDIKTESMNKGGTIQIQNTKVTMTDAVHTSFFENGNLSSACGYIIDCEKKVYHAGDTSIFSDMKLIGGKGIDVAMLPIGDRYTMGIEDAVMAVSWLKPAVVIPMHYNTFPHIKQNAQKFKTLVEAMGEAEVAVLKPGESIEI